MKAIARCGLLLVLLILLVGCTTRETTVTGTVQSKQYTPAHHGSGLGISAANGGLTMNHINMSNGTFDAASIPLDEDEPERWQVSIMVDDGSYVIDDKGLYQSCEVGDTIEVVKTEWINRKGKVISTSVGLPDK